MYKCVLEKFRQHIGIRKTLLGTGNAILVEHTTNDSYWGDGGDGSGKNMLGITLNK
jgi:N-glycosidase YbiA